MKKKVVYVDFRKRRKPTAGGFGGSPRTLFLVFLVLLCVEILVVAAFYPRAIGTGFFGPTVIAVAVIGTLGVRRVIARLQVDWLHRVSTEQARSAAPDPDGDHKDRTLH